MVKSGPRGDGQVFRLVDQSQAGIRTGVTFQELEGVRDNMQRYWSIIGAMKKRETSVMPLE